MKMKLIYIVVITLFINLNINYALNKKAFLGEQPQANTPTQTEKKSDEGENKQEKNENKSAKLKSLNSADEGEKNIVITESKINQEHNTTKPYNRTISTDEIETENSKATDTKTDKTSPVKLEGSEKPKSEEKNGINVNKSKAEEKNNVDADLKTSENGSQKKELPKPLNNNNIINNEIKNNINNNENKNNINKNINKINANDNINQNNIINNSVEKIEPSGTANVKGLENNPSAKSEAVNKPNSNEKIVPFRTADIKNIENNQSMKAEAVNRQKSEEKKDNFANRVKLPEKSDKGEASLEKTTILHPASYHREAEAMNPTPMVSSATRVAATVVGPSCVTPLQTVITPIMTPSLLPPGTIRETTIISTPITPILPMLQRNLRVTEMVSPMQAVQAFGTPIAHAYNTSPFAPLNRSMGFSAAFAPQPPVIQKTVTQNTINGIPFGPPLVNTVITPPFPQIANRLISQVPVVNGVMSPSPIMMNRMASPAPFINGGMSPGPLTMMNRIASPTPIFNGGMSPGPVTMMNRIVNTPVFNGVVSPATITMTNRMANSTPIVNGFANRNSNDVYVFG